MAPVKEIKIQWKCEDGSLFDSEADAVRHQRTWEIAQEIVNLPNSDMDCSRCRLSVTMIAEWIHDHFDRKPI